MPFQPKLALKLKMYFRITMPAMVTNMDVAEEGCNFIFDDYNPDLQEHSRVVMALLVSLFTGAASLWARTRVYCGNNVSDSNYGAN